ncbi:MAG: hypothetical protein U0694_25585 [Anaerolineae bacterium]
MLSIYETILDIEYFHDLLAVQHSRSQQSLYSLGVRGSDSDVRRMPCRATD